jgi:hypothetical protein
MDSSLLIIVLQHAVKMILGAWREEALGVALWLYTSFFPVWILS